MTFPTLKKILIELTAQNVACICRGGIKNKELGLMLRHGLLANVSAGVSVTTEVLLKCLSGRKWLLHTTALWP